MRALVTGANLQGIGGAVCRGIARDAAASGKRARILVSASSPKPELEQLRAEVAALGAKVKLMTGDLADAALPRRLVEGALEFCGGLDAVVYNAGVTLRASMLEAAAADWDRVFNINTRAALLLAQAAFPHLKASKGSLVLIGSISGTSPHMGYAPYSPSKAALITLGQAMADEWAPHGVRVNIVSPGPVASPFAPQLKDPAVVAQRRGIIPAGRVGQPEDIAAVVSYLLGPDGVYTIGQNIVADGGLAKSGLNRLPGVKLQ